MPDKPDAIHHRAWRLVVRPIDLTSHAVALVFFDWSTFYSLLLYFLAAKPRPLGVPGVLAVRMPFRFLAEFLTIQGASP
jgi:hypothetical protein